MASWIAGGCQGFNFEVAEEGSEAEASFGMYSEASICVEEFEGMKSSNDGQYMKGVEREESEYLTDE